MTVLHSGATVRYSDNFSKAFGKKTGAVKKERQVVAKKRAKKTTKKAR